MEQGGASAGRATRVLMLVDEPIDFDRRVRLFTGRYRARGLEVDVLDILKHAGAPGLASTLGAAWRTGCFILTSILPRVPGLGDRVLRMLRDAGSRHYDGQPTFRFMKLALNETVGMYFRGARARASLRGYGVMHANDLRCALFAAGAAGDTPIVYDSHEFNAFRNRTRMSWFRIGINCVHEAAVVRRAACVLTVSTPIADAFHSLYDDTRAVLLENRFYDGATVEPVTAPRIPDGKTSLVYFGALNTGRGLSLLNALGGQDGISVVAFVYGGGSERDRRLRADLANIAVIDQKDPHSLAFPTGMLSRRPLSWCVVENVSLSYIFALPNKFFQSLSLGLPIVAARGTHVGRLAQEHGIGLVIDAGGDPAQIAKQIEAIGADQYAEMQAAVRRMAQSYAARPVEAVADECIVSALR